MPWIERVRTEQPLDAGVGVDWGNPITRGLRVILNGADNQVAPWTIIGGASRSLDQTGISRLVNGSNQALSTPLDLTNTKAVTVVSLMTPVGYSSPYNMFWEFTADGNAVNGGFALYSNNSSARIDIGCNGGGTDSANYSPRFATGVPVSLAATYDHTKPNGQQIGLFTNGVPTAVTVSGSLGGSGSFGNSTLYLGARTASTLWAYNKYTFFVLFDCRKTDAEIKSLYDNPWQVFEKERIWVPAAAGGDSTITQADGTSTASSLGGSATAATTPAAADGTSTAASIAASATAAAAVTQADGASTAATLVGVASTGSTITQADGSTVASVLAGSATSSAAATQADGVSTVGTLAGSATAASVLSSADGSSSTSTAAGSATSAAALTQADGLSTASTLSGTGTGIAALTQADGVSTTGTLTGTGLAAGSSAITQADGASTVGTLAGSSAAIAAITQADGTTTASTLSSSSVSPAVMTAGDGASTTTILGGSAIFVAAMTQASSATTASAFAASAVAACVAIAAAGASSAQALAGIPPNTSNLAGIIYEVPEDVRRSTVLADARGFTVLWRT